MDNVYNLFKRRLNDYWLIKKLNSSIFGINYDIGNSIGYGFNYRLEIKKLIKFIKNVHIKNKKIIEHVICFLIRVKLI